MAVQTRDVAGRSARTEKAILDATRELLAEGGVRGLTVERVAARSGVAKTSIYRRWRSKHDVALTHELLFGPVYYRLLLSGGKLDRGLAQRIVDAVWPSIERNSKPAST